MTIQTAKPFASYVVEQELAATDARKFEMVIPYEIEGTKRTASWRRAWTYSDTQRAIDEKNGVDGLPQRRQQELQTFERGVTQELKQHGQRLYSVEGQTIPVRGKA